jgi:galactokinase
MKVHVRSHAAIPGLSDTAAAAAGEWHYLRDVLNAFGGDSAAAVALAREAIHEQPWSLLEMRTALGGKCDELLAAKMLPPDNDPYWQSFEGFKPLQRAAHVLAEAGRVHSCASALRAGKVDVAAQAMTESHVSCRDLYEISTPQVEQLVTAALGCGALAARITGAGFGGSIVTMVKSSEASQFREWLWKDHFSKMSTEQLAGAQPETCILECLPSEGAHILPL